MSISLQSSPDGTYGEIKVNGSVVAKLPLSGNAVIPGLVGTVSQSGGVPTGAVIERGSNANGTYVRFADGTQICLVQTAFTSDVTTASGSVFISSAQLISLPATFVGDYQTAPLAQAFGGTWLTGESGSTSSSVSLRAMRAVASAVDFTVSIIAVGRWY